MDRRLPNALYETAPLLLQLGRIVIIDANRWDGPGEAELFIHKQTVW